jgi:hypothetical protein
MMMMMMMMMMMVMMMMMMMIMTVPFGVIGLGAMMEADNPYRDVAYIISGGPRLMHAGRGNS